VSTLGHQAYDSRESSKVGGLRRDQRVCFEERNDTGRQINQGPDAEAPDVLSMIVVPAIATDTPTSEELLQCMQYLHAPLSLHHREARLNLSAQTTRWIAEDRNTEAALAVDKADDPLRKTWPFLLIVRTGRFVTEHSPNRNYRL
jgi:hypothetical protein